MAQQLILVLAVCLSIASGAMVRREAGGADDPLVQMQQHGAEFVKTFSEGLNSVVNSKNSQEFTEALKQGSDSVLQQLSAFSATLQNALGDANGKAKEVIEKARENIEKSVSELRKSHPEVEQQSTELKNKLQQAVTSTVQEADKVAKAVAASMEETNKKLAPQVKQAFDDFVKQAQEVQRKVHEAATKQ